MSPRSSSPQKGINKEKRGEKRKSQPTDVPASSALPRVSILGQSPKLYNPVGSPRLRTASPINQAWITPLPLAATFYGIPVWARRFKPTRPAEAERPPLSLGSSRAAEPQGSWSPHFRNVWLRTGEAGLVESRTGCRMIISGRTGGDTNAKSFYFPCRRSKPAATQRLPRGTTSASPRRMVL